jgi:hypothetical protein
MIRYFIVCMVLLLFVGCQSVTKVGDIAALSTIKADIQTWERAGERVNGSSCSNWVLFFDFGDKSLKNAVENALDPNKDKLSTKLSLISKEVSSVVAKLEGGTGEAQFDSLMDASIETSRSNYFVYIKDCILVSGTPANSWSKSSGKKDNKAQTPKTPDPKVNKKEQGKGY